MRSPFDDLKRQPRRDLGAFRVTVLGVGSVGSFAALALASRGVGVLDLVDREVLEPANLRRHVGSVAALGTSKAKIVAQEIHARFTNVKANAHSLCILNDASAVRLILQDADVILVAVDCEGPKYCVDAMAWELNKPGVYAGVYGGGWAAEFLAIDPRRPTACYGCAAQAMGRTGIDHEPDPQHAYRVSNQDAPPNAWIEADLTSIFPTAMFAATEVMNYLESPNDFFPADAIGWRLPFHQIPAWQSEPWKVQPLASKARPDCPTCGMVRSCNVASAFAKLLPGDVT